MVNGIKEKVVKVMKIFLAGSVSGASKNQLSKYEVYKKVVLSTYPKATIITPDDIYAYRKKCIETNPSFSKIPIDKLMVDFDLEQVKESDLVVCDISEQSCGMGLELGICKENNIKIIFCFKKGAYVSSMIYGTFNNSNFIEYETTDDLKNQLTYALKIMKNKKRVSK